MFGIFYSQYVVFTKMPDDRAQSLVLGETEDPHTAVPMASRDQHLAIVRQAEQLTV